MLSDSPPERDVIWTDDGVQGAAQFVQRALAADRELAGVAAPARCGDRPITSRPAAMEVRKAAHGALIKVEEDIGRLRFNRAVAHIYDFANKIVGCDRRRSTTPDIARRSALMPSARRLTYSCGFSRR